MTRTSQIPRSAFGNAASGARAALVRIIARQRARQQVQPIPFLPIAALGLPFDESGGADGRMD